MRAVSYYSICILHMDLSVHTTFSLYADLALLSLYTQTHTHIQSIFLYHQNMKLHQTHMQKNDSRQFILMRGKYRNATHHGTWTGLHYVSMRECDSGITQCYIYIRWFWLRNESVFDSLILSSKRKCSNEGVFATAPHHLVHTDTYPNDSSFSFRFDTINCIHFWVRYFLSQFYSLYIATYLPERKRCLCMFSLTFGVFFSAMYEYSWLRLKRMLSVWRPSRGRCRRRANCVCVRVGVSHLHICCLNWLHRYVI